MTTMLSATKLKVTVALNPDELANAPAIDGRPRTVLRVKLPDKTVTADIATKSLRKAHATIRELGIASVACILQGVLIGVDTIGEAGLTVQPKAPKKVEAQGARAMETSVHG